MRRRRKNKTPAHELRTLAQAGRWEDLRALLAARLTRDPHDAEARSELERLNQGLPLRAMESPLTRRRREEQEMQEELAAELALYRSQPALPGEWDAQLLARRRRRVALIRARLGKRLPADMQQEAETYLAAIDSQLAAKHGKRRRRLALALGLPLLAAVLGGTGLALHQRADLADQQLLAAMQARDVARVEKAVSVADSGIHRLVHRPLAGHLFDAHLWLARMARLREELDAELAALEEEEEGSISQLPLVRRAAMEDKLRALPPCMAAWQERWQRLCEKEERALAAQRAEVRQRFNTPLPPLPALVGTLPEDDAILKAQQQLMQTTLEEWRAAHRLFQLAPEQGEALQARLDELRLLREDIAALRRCIALLPTARSYAQYCSILEQHRPARYAPALRMAAIHDLLPEEDKLRDLMQDHGRQLPPGMLDAARHAHLDGGASFAPAFPANARQLQLMEDLFSYSGLRKVLFELSAPTLPSFIVEERPQVSEESVCFSPSPLTPGYTLDTPRRITWHNPQGVFIRRIDATPLLRETGIERESFFSNANLPALLDTLLRVEHEECPALARAYVFKRLLEVMATHDWPTMLGIAYAPTLRADARDFAALCHRLNESPEAGCWLKPAHEIARDEEECARWFRERRHRHYADEIKRNFGSLVQVHPHYIGYIDGEGTPQLYRRYPNGTLLWYVAEGGLTAAPLGEALEAPVPYSPLFIVAKN